MFRNLFVIAVSIICLSIAIFGCGKKKEEVVKKEVKPDMARTPVPKRKVAKVPTRPEVELEPLVIKEEKVIFNFERDDGGWEIPMWAEEQDDYVANGY